MSWSRWFLSPAETVCHDCGEDFYCCYLTRDYWPTELWSVEVLQWQWDNVCPAETGAGSTRMSHSGYNIITDMWHHSAVLSGFFFNIIIDMIVSDIWIWSAGNDCSSIIMLEKMIRVILAIIGYFHQIHNIQFVDNNWNWGAKKIFLKHQILHVSTLKCTDVSPNGENKLRIIF